MNIKSVIMISLAVFGAAGCARVMLKPDLSYGFAEFNWVNRMMKKMSLEEKVGQMVAWQYNGNFYNADSDTMKDLEDLIATHGIGGLVVFAGNVYETAYLANAFQRMAKVPLLIASDFERGVANRITGSTLFPNMMSIGAADSEDLAYRMGKITAEEGRALGVHMAYAPVVDVNINPDNPIINTRSIGEDPERVSRLAAAFIRGCQENGLIATAKHFPGHGDTDVDSHSLLPVIRADRGRLDEVELYTFKKAIEAGVQAIMTAHLNVPALDATPDLPATLSPLILTDLLRKQFGFRGLIVTDAMTMGGITNTYSNTDAALKAIMAGVDMVLLPPEPGKVVAFLKEAARSGRIPEARINQSVRRILMAKARLGLYRQKLVDIDALSQKISSKESLRQAALTFESAATLVKNEGDVLPLPTLSKKIAVLSLSSDPGDYFAGRAFAEGVRKRCPEAQIFYADADTGRESLEEAVAKSSEADAVVCALFSRLSDRKGSVGLDSKHIDLIKRFAEGERPIVILSFGSPYFLRYFPDVDAYLCLYQNTPQTQDIAARAIFGEMEIKGKLPVSLPDLYPIGHGILLPKK
jgi:beta-N-acetylhexosaminidase